MAFINLYSQHAFSDSFQLHILSFLSFVFISLFSHMYLLSKHLKQIMETYTKWYQNKKIGLEEWKLQSGNRKGPQKEMSQFIDNKETWPELQESDPQLPVKRQEIKYALEHLYFSSELYTSHESQESFHHSQVIKQFAHFLKVFIRFLSFTFKSLMHLESILVHTVKCSTNFFFHRATQSSLHFLISQLYPTGLKCLFYHILTPMCIYLLYFQSIQLHWHFQLYTSSVFLNYCVIINMFSQ